MQERIASTNEHRVTRLLAIGLYTFTVAALVNDQSSLRWSPALCSVVLSLTALCAFVSALLFGAQVHSQSRNGCAALATGFALGGVSIVLSVLASPLAPFEQVLHVANGTSAALRSLGIDIIAGAIIADACIVRCGGKPGIASMTLALAWLAALIALLRYDPSTSLAAAIAFGVAALAAGVRGFKRNQTTLDVALTMASLAFVLAELLTLRSGPRITLAAYVVLGDVFFGVALVLGTLIRHSAWLTNELAEQRRELAAIVATDGLTGVSNRRRFDEEYLRAHGTASRRDGPLALAIIDLDRFHRFNEFFGHEAGDRALQIVADAIAISALRRGDFVARYGGEEFIMILEDTDLEGATAVAEKVRAAVLEAGITDIDDLPFSVSIGVAARMSSETSEALLRRTWAAIGAAKSAGRNRVFTSRLGEATILR